MSHFRLFSILSRYSFSFTNEEGYSVVHFVNRHTIAVKLRKIYNFAISNIFLLFQDIFSVYSQKCRVRDDMWPLVTHS